MTEGEIRAAGREHIARYLLNQEWELAEAWAGLQKDSATGVGPSFVIIRDEIRRAALRVLNPTRVLTDEEAAKVLEEMVMAAKT